MATEDSKAMAEADKMEVDDDPVSKDSHEKVIVNSSAGDSESKKPTAKEGNNSNLVSEKFNSLTSRLQLLERRLKGPTEESDAEETSLIEGPSIPPSLNIIEAFSLNDSNLKKKSGSKSKANDNSIGDSQLNSSGKEAAALKDDAAGSDKSEKTVDVAQENCKKDISKETKAETVTNEPSEIKANKEQAENKENEKDLQVEKTAYKSAKPCDIESVEHSEIKDDSKTESKEKIKNKTESKETVDSEEKSIEQVESKETVDSEAKSIEKVEGKTEPKAETDGDNESIDKENLESKESTIKPSDSCVSKDGDIKKVKKSNVEESGTEEKATKQESSTGDTVESNEDETVEKPAEDSDQATKSDSKDNKDVVAAAKKGRGIDAIASMLRKHQVKGDTNGSDNKKTPKNKEPKSEIQGYFADTMNEFLGMYGYEKESQKEGSSEKKSEATAESASANTPKATTENKEKSSSSKRLKTCEECKEVKVCKYQVMMQGSEKFIRTHICDDTCYTLFKEKQKQQRNSAKRITRSHTKEICNVCSRDIKNSAGYIPPYGENKLIICSEVCYKKFKQQQGPKRKCAQCKRSIEGRNKCLTWETMEFCTEECLRNYQNYLGSHCACCNSAVQNSSLGKFCVRFGSDIKQFCSNTCLEEFKKGLKVCTFCQKDISDGYDGFLAPVGDKGQFKDFCSQQCMEKYDVMNNPNGAPPKLSHCAVCHKLKAIKIEVDYEGTAYEICAELCYAAFRYAHKIKQHKCDHCHKLFDIGSAEDQGQHTVQMDGIGKRFCTKMCLNIFVLSNRKIVPCSWCKVKKYNFDMIERADGTNQVQLFCSLNCLSLFRVSLNASSSKSVKCDFCSKNAAAQYHLTMSDATVRNFCCYTCVAKFQNQYPSGNFQKVSATNQVNVTKGTTTAQAKSSSPAISSVISVSPQTVSRIQTGNFNRQGSATSTKSVTTPSLSKIPINRPANSPKPSSVGSSPQTVIVKPPQPKMLKNKGTMCKPIMLTKGVSCRPHPCYKETQSETIPETKSEGIIKYIPIPLPIYVPMPMHMYSMPTPVLLPIPIPVPVPIFIPTTKDSAESIIRSIKEIREKADAIGNSTDVSDSKEDQKEEESKAKSEDSDSEEKSASSNNEVDESDSQDDLMEENGETCSSPENSVKKPAKRPASNGSPHKTLNKRQKTALGNENHDKLNKANHETPPPKSHSSSIDLSGNLKYMYGVNAWKNWVINKNQQLEKASQSNRKLKLFKTDILQLTADELNYSLCLFVKEVRNQSGGEYDADRIYYLCLGIQQYLFLNNRVDNILTDANFEKFTECLNDALSSYETKRQISDGKFMARVNAEILWESRQLGAHSPHVLLNTLLYFNTKYFGLKSVEDHLKMSFSQVVKTWKKSGKSHLSCLRYHSPNQTPPARGSKRKKEVLEQSENLDNPLRCPVKLYEFYLSKCPEAIKPRTDVYYLYPERSCMPDSPVWYSMQPLGKDQLNKMLQRAKMIKGAFNHV